MIKKAIIVFSGFNQRAVIAFLRTLERTRVAYTIVACSPEDSIFQTAYREHVSATRLIKALNLDDLQSSIEQAKKILKAEEYVIAPSTEALNRFLLHHRDTFERACCEIPLVHKELYEQISDKYAFSELCEQYDIRMPAEYETEEAVVLPCVAKPRKYVATDGETYSPVLLHTEEELSDFRKNYEPCDFYFQEFVDGSSLYLLYYFYKDGKMTKFSQQNLMQQPGGKSIIAAVSSEFHNDEESEKYEGLFSSIGFSGLVMVEVKKQNGHYYMIEANPRFWGPSQLFVDAGVNLFDAFLADHGLLPPRPELLENSKKARYFWYGGMAGLSYDQITYHNYSKKLFETERDDWMTADIYSRDDTKDIFKEEVERR